MQPIAELYAEKCINLTKNFGLEFEFQQIGIPSPFTEYPDLMDLSVIYAH